MNKKNYPRIYNLILKAISTFSLDLKGFTVLTEAATNYYALTPLIAAIARADHVYALTRDSKYGKAEDVDKEINKIASQWNVVNKIEILSSREDERIKEADIVTNLGFVRPLNAPFLKKLKETAVIPLMWETWEYRSEDLDLKECRKLNIPVLGTNEHHSDLKIFEYIGHLVIKLLMEVDIEIYDSKIVILGQGEFAEKTFITLKAIKSKVFYQQTDEISEKPKNDLYEFLEHADALVIIDHHSKKQLIGREGSITAEKLLSINPGITVVHLCGNIDRNELLKKGIYCWPQKFAPVEHMSATTDHLGPKPLVLLHTAGLKIAEELAKVRLKSLSAYDSEVQVLRKLKFAQGFKDYHPV